MTRCITRECESPASDDDVRCHECLAEIARWRRHFGQDDPDPEVRRQTLEAMRPLKRDPR